MRIPLSEFELHVRPEPLERGLTLYEQGQVESIRSDGEGALEAVVHDADGLWHPGLKIKNEIIVLTHCDCGQATDNLCKHGVAVVFAMEAGQFKEGITTKSGKIAKEKVAGKGRSRPKLDEEPVKKTPKAKAIKPPKPPKTAADILARVPHEEIVAFLLQECKLDKNIEVRLKAHFADLLPATTPAEVEKRITEITSASIGKSGRMNKGAMILLVKRLTEWADESGRYAANQHYDLAFAAARSILEALLDLNNENYAPLEDIKSALKKVQGTIDLLCKSEITGKMRDEIFAKIVILHRGYSRHTSYLRLASCICLSGAEFETIDKLFGNDPDDAEATEARWEMTRRIQGDAAAAEFEKKHANHRFFISRRIEEARKRGDLKTAIKEALKGFDKSQHNPTRLGFWGHLADDLMIEAGDLNGRVELAVKLYKFGYRTERVNLQNILKIAGPERWREERAKLMMDKDPKKYQHHDAILNLYEIDEDWDGFAKTFAGFTPSQILSWSPTLMRRKKEVYWMIVKQAMEVSITKKTALRDQTFTSLLRELVRMKGKEAATEVVKEMHLKDPSNQILAELFRSIGQLMRHMSIGYY